MTRARAIAVLLGGWSAERAVSLRTGANIAAALRRLGHDVTEIDAGRDLAKRLAALDPRPDVIFNALHGVGGEDGSVQGLLEVMGFPYTHSGVLASAIAMHKPTARKLFKAAGLPCPEGRTAAMEELCSGDVLPRPYVVKPVAEGSSVGVRIITDDDPFPAFDRSSWPYAERVLVEAFIPGREITVAVMGGKPLGVLEIRPRTAFYDYAAKYQPGQSDHVVPAPIAEEAYHDALRISAEAHRVLGCRGVTRADLRLDDTAGSPGRLYLLEVNTQPGMTETSLVPEIAAHAGIGFDGLVDWMMEDALCRR